WILNIRGRDVPCNPVVLAFLVIHQDVAKLFIDRSKLDEDEKSVLKGAGVEIAEYEELYAQLKDSGQRGRVLIDPQRTCFAVYDALSNTEVAEAMNPSTLLKSIKNQVEIKHVRNVM